MQEVNGAIPRLIHVVDDSLPHPSCLAARMVVPSYSWCLLAVQQGHGNPPLHPSCSWCLLAAQQGHGDPPLHPSCNWCLLISQMVTPHSIPLVVGASLQHSKGMVSPHSTPLVVGASLQQSKGMVISYFTPLVASLQQSTPLHPSCSL